MAKKYDMTIKDAIFNLEDIAKNTNDDKVVAKIRCAIADLEAYKEVNDGDLTIDEVIAEHIERKKSVTASVDSHWVRKLNHDIFEMMEDKNLSELKQLESEKEKRLNNVIQVSNNTIDDFSQYCNKRKTHRVLSWCAYGAIIVAAAFTFLSSFVECFMGWGSTVGAIIGLCDFAAGLIFQLYERKDDMNQKSATKEAKSRLQACYDIHKGNTRIEQTITDNSNSSGCNQTANGDNNVQNMTAIVGNNTKRFKR